MEYFAKALEFTENCTIWKLWCNFLFVF